ncbi:hypothetical protein K9U39_12855 [Rhodoblastus acidophilus]|uniref:Glycosyltransferase RgtA/B/C/D-like domain-containing protein n=1 Tax=Candidatus Rhodoblastus alkanivorans TaxID=2954117 RepID=A0ABS9ZA31_9HYPH|nr:hypothetical protein [Candidatus Rhodoblastus alkanivorans]MCI4677146.1 hypothetical protein [Candidatus Rhodoblastus alkanivorans]MCI4684499.1 hypothetical protein [Candidatus Rhodoblastus alkanivorans]MDI4641820.1 hypothetical protein [Rhodoblastus acidophilus]
MILREELATPIPGARADQSCPVNDNPAAASSRTAGSPRGAGSPRVAVLAFVGVFLLILASKFLLIHFASSQVPFSDEWDGDAVSTIKPFLEGHFGFWSLFQRDNEHLIVPTRLVTILNLKISGYWDVVLPMIFNALLHSATLALLLAALTRALDGPKLMVAAIVGCGLALLPFGHENTLLGFNTHFYTVMAFSFAAIWLFADAEAWSLRWFSAVLLASGAFLSMASGALAPAIGAGLALLQIARRARSGAAEWLAAAALLALSALFVALTPHIPENDVYHAHSISAFLLGFADLLAWPLHNPIGALLYAPGLAFAFVLLRDAPARDDPRWFNLGVLAWSLVQCAALAFGRNGMVVSRYLDFSVVGLLVNLVAALWLAPRLDIFADPRHLARLALAVAAIIAALLVINHGRVGKVAAILQRHDDARIEEANLRAFVTTGDAAALAGKTIPQIPYPSAERLKSLLDDPTIRATLPPDVNPDQRIRPAVEAIKALLLDAWPFFFAAGLFCWAVAIREAPGHRPGETPLLREIPREAS